MLGSIGVVYGDIGTSPLYALREAVVAASGSEGGATTQAVLGILSLILWALIVVVTLKYVVILLRADNNGEGGTLALMALAQRAVSKNAGTIVLLGIISGALFYGDAVITPAQSVLSAIEGIKLVTAAADPYVVPLTMIILMALFAVQSRGTARVAAFFGPIMDVASGQVREAGGFDGAKNIDPQWSQDGKSLYFLSDRQGITNVYRLPLDGGDPMQLTNILTGVSGITSLSPALSAGNGRLVFSAYENDGYNIYALDGDKVMAETPPIQLPIDAGVLPPRRTGEGPVFAAITDQTTGLPAAAPAETQPYKPKFSLDYAGQPTIGIGTDPFGTYATGGVSFLFSDTLGNHVDLRARVLVIGEIEQRSALDDADARGGDVIGNRQRLDLSARAHLLQRQYQRDEPASDRRGSGAAVGLDDVAIDPDCALTEIGQFRHRSEGSTDQPLNLLCASADFPRRRFTLRAGRRGPGQHAVFGRHPALAGVAEKWRHPILDTGRADHSGASGFDQDRPFCVHREVRRHARRPKLPGCASIQSRHRHLSLSVWSSVHLRFFWSG